MNLWIKTSYLNEEVNCTEPSSPLVSVLYFKSNIFRKAMNPYSWYSLTLALLLRRRIQTLKNGLAYDKKLVNYKLQSFLGLGAGRSSSEEKPQIGLVDFTPVLGRFFAILWNQR
jgi:hypothetical protein